MASRGETGKPWAIENQGALFGEVSDEIHHVSQIVLHKITRSHEFNIWHVYLKNYYASVLIPMQIVKVLPSMEIYIHLEGGSVMGASKMDIFCAIQTEQILRLMGSIERKSLAI
ncbi:hypothetical protein ACJX0J_009535 [Zea mays]